MGWFFVKSLRRFSPAITDEFVGTSSLQGLEPLGKIVGLQEYLQMLSQLIMAPVKVAMHRLFFDAAVHALDLPIRPRVIRFGQAMVNAMRYTNLIKFQLAFLLGPRLMRKLRAIVGQDRVDFVGDGFDQPAQKRAGVFAAGAFKQLSEGKLGCAVNSHKEIELALLGSNLADVQVKVADGVLFETLLLGPLAFGFGQAADAMALEAAMQGRPGQMRYRLLQGVKAVIQRQQCFAAEGNDDGFFLHGQDSRAWLFRTHRLVLDSVSPLPFGDRLGVDAEALGQFSYALLTILYFSAGCLCCCGARV